MKRREIMCLLAGCMLLLTPMQTRATNLLDILSIGTINTEISGVSGDKDTAEDTKNENTDNQDVEDSYGTERATGQDGRSAGEMTEPDGTEVDLSDGAEESGQTDKESDLQDILGGAIGSSVILESTKTEIEYAEAYEKAKNANWGYTNLGIAHVDNNLNIRAAAEEEGKLVGKLPKDAACEVLDSDDTWAHIKSGKVEGYVSLEYLLTGIPAKRRAEELAVTMARVTTDSLKVRAQANTESEVITLVPNGEELEVADVEGDWVKVYLDDEEQTLLYSSPVLPTGKRLDKLKLNQVLPDGSYDAICTYHILDDEDPDIELGNVSFSVSLMFVK